uniref:exopolysaccharide biosynthesis polyprenyl glycosylphosphotransferase n=1 Tax=Agathobacter sp. TaxID=2021311 RepID=UPI00405643AC
MKNSKFQKDILRLLKLMNIILVTLPFAAGWLLHYADRTASPYYAKGNYLIIVLFAVLYAIYGKVYDALLVSMGTVSEMVYSQGIAAFVSDAVMYVVIWLLTKHLPSMLPMALIFVGQLACAALWSWMGQRWYFRRFPPKRTTVVYGNRTGMEHLVKEYKLEKKFDVRQVISAENCIRRQMTELAETEVVFFCGVHSHDRNVILKYCVANDIRAYIIPRIGDLLMSSAQQMHMLHLPILKVERYNPPMEYLMMKRLLDVLVSGAALTVLSPVMVLTAIAIHMTDKGPAFYRQCRLTKDGKEFDVLKFRSMRTDAEKDGIARLSTGNRDDRVTPVGKFIRKTRIDELPQLINILKGDMTLVGPRPERPEIARQYEKELPEFALRLQAKAGLTGYAQVYGKYNTTPYDKLQMDLMYIAKPSILEDLRIMFATVKILFLPESTEGVAEGQVTASEEIDSYEKEKAIEL